LKYVAPAGRLVFVGLCKAPVCIDDAMFHAREVTLYASRNSCQQFPRIIRMIEDRRIDTTPWITDRIPLSEVPRVFPELRQRPGTIKAIIEMHESDAE
jgi:threonine dehydrogenase-like Zn-dependent dehydrogenase